LEYKNELRREEIMDDELDTAVEACLEHSSNYEFNSEKHRWEVHCTRAKNFGYGSSREEAAKMLYKIVRNAVRKRPELEGLPDHEAAQIQPQSNSSQGSVYNINNNYTTHGISASGEIGEMNKISVTVGSQSAKTPIETAKDWHEKRLNDIRSRKGPNVLKDGPMLIVHLVPLAPLSKFDVPTVKQHCQFPPRYQKGVSFTPRANLDGYTTVDDATDYPDSVCRGYVQVFRDGKIESVRVLRLFTQDNKNSLWGSDIDRQVCCAISDYFVALRELGANPPFALTITMMNVKNVPLLYGPHPIVEAEYDLPVRIINEFPSDISPENVALLLRDELDMIWQSSGQDRSKSFNDDGSLQAKFLR
jgi:hypothetical protein